VIYLTNLTRVSTSPLVYTVDVAVKNNTVAPPRSYFVRMFYNGDHFNLTQATDVELGQGAVPPVSHTLGPVQGSGLSTYRNVSAFTGNINNKKYNLVLVRLRFEAKVSSPALWTIYVTEGQPNPLLIDVSGNEIPATIEYPYVIGTPTPSPTPSLTPSPSPTPLPPDIFKRNLHFVSANPVRFTLDVAVRNNLYEPLMNYAIRVHYDRSLAELIEASDAGLGDGMTPPLTHVIGPVQGEEADTWREVTAAGGNPASTQRDPGLVRLLFESKQPYPVHNSIWVGDVPTTPPLTGVSGAPIPANFINEAFPLPGGDSDGDGYADWYEEASGTSPNDPAQRPILGDVNGDGKVTLTDAVALRRHATGVIVLPNFDCEARGDLDRDGACTVTDALILYQWITGQAAVIPTE